MACTHIGFSTFVTSSLFSDFVGITWPTKSEKLPKTKSRSVTQVLTSLFSSLFLSCEIVWTYLILKSVKKICHKIYIKIVWILNFERKYVHSFYTILKTYRWFPHTKITVVSKLNQLDFTKKHLKF